MRVAVECGFGHISRPTIYKAFHDKGYHRCKPSYKPRLNSEQKKKRLNQCRTWERENTSFDFVLCTDEVRMTTGWTDNNKLVTRTTNERWHLDCIVAEEE